MSSTEPLSADAFVEELKSEIAGFPKLRVNHPFVEAVCSGAATMEKIRAWAVQDYQFRRAVPHIALLRYVACTDPEFAPRLFEVAEDVGRRYLDSPNLQQQTREVTFRRMELLYDIWTIGAA